LPVIIPSMKTFLKLFTAAILLAGVAACRDVGYNGKTLNNDATPDVSQKGYVRTYDQNGNPIVTPASTPGATDPASPNSHGSN